MTPGRRERARRIVAEAADCDPLVREALLSDRCGGDDALRAEVLRLLRDDTVSSPEDSLEPRTDADLPLLDETRAGGLAAVPAAAGPLPEIPGYEILAELGRGGMGVVYKARAAAAQPHLRLEADLGGRPGRRRGDGPFPRRGQDHRPAAAPQRRPDLPLRPARRPAVLRDGVRRGGDPRTAAHRRPVAGRPRGLADRRGGAGRRRGPPATGSCTATSSRPTSS